MAKRVFDQIPNFSGGLNQAPGEQLANNEVVIARNARFFQPDGALGRRFGTRKTNNTPLQGGTTVTGLFVTTGGSLLAVTNGALDEDLNPTGTAASTWVNRAASGSMSSSGKNSFATFYDGGAAVVYITDGGRLNKYNPTTNVFTADCSIASVFAVTTILVYNQRLWGLNSGGDTLYFSDIDDGDTLGDAANGGGSIILRNSGVGGLLALGASGNSMYVFAERAIFRFSGFGIDDFNFEVGTRGHSTTVGTTDHTCVAATDHGIYFQSTFGLYLTNESGTTKISGKLPRLLNPTGPGSDRLTMHKADRQEVWFYVANERRTYVYNYALNAWSTWQSSGNDTLGFGNANPGAIQVTPTAWCDGPTPLTETLNSGTTERPAYIGYSNGFVCKAAATPLYQDGQPAGGGTGGETVALFAKTKGLGFGDRFKRVGLRRVHVSLDAGDQVFLTPVLFGQSGTQVSLTVGTVFGIARVSMPLGGSSTSPAFVIEFSSTSTNRLRISSMKFDAQQYNRPVGQGVVEETEN